MSIKISQRLDLAGGVTSGFDYLRIGLAVAILLWHGLQLSYGMPAEIAAFQTPLAGIIRLLLPMFFALSGFLVCGSLVRSKSLIGFCMHRALRLVPALAVEVTLSALILGPLLTTRPLRSYVSNPEFRSYFLNIAGFIHYRLPGVFDGNPLPLIVNGNLWTIPSELECYLILIVIALSTLLRRRAAFTVLVALAWLAFWGGTWWTGWIGGLRPGLWDPVGGLAPVLLMPGRGLVLSFIAGLLLYVWRDRVPLSRGLFTASAVASYALVVTPHLVLLAPLPIAYLTVSLGLTSPRKLRLITDGDYSYGVYLFAFPIQQTCSNLVPDLRTWWFNILLCLPASMLYAYGSWHLVEKPILARRKPLVATVERSLGRLASRWPVRRPAGPQSIASHPAHSATVD